MIAFAFGKPSHCSLLVENHLLFQEFHCQRKIYLQLPEFEKVISVSFSGSGHLLLHWISHRSPSSNVIKVNWTGEKADCLWRVSEHGSCFSDGQSSCSSLTAAICRSTHHQQFAINTQVVYTDHSKIILESKLWLTKASSRHCFPLQK